VLTGIAAHQSIVLETYPQRNIVAEVPVAFLLANTATDLLTAINATVPSGIPACCVCSLQLLPSLAP
jgi:hypothetical protein